MNPRNLKQSITAFRRHPRMQPVWTGIAWAAAVLVVGNCYFYVLSFNSDISPYFLGLLIMLPVPLLLGALAGVLAQFHWQNYFMARAACLSVAGMIGFYGGIGYLILTFSSLATAGGLDNFYVLLAGASLIAACIQLVLNALMFAVAYLVDHVIFRQPGNAQPAHSSEEDERETAD